MIHFEKIIMPAASMGDVNPMPDISDAGYIHAKYNTTEKVTDMNSIFHPPVHTLLPDMTFSLTEMIFLFQYRI